MQKTIQAPKKKRKMKKVIFIISLVAIIAVAGAFAVPRFLIPNTAQASTFSNTNVKTGSISTTVEASGNLEVNINEIEIP